MLSSLVTVTRAPCFAVSEAGMNLKLLILIASVAPEDVDCEDPLFELAGGFGLAAELEPPPPPPPQPASRIAVVARRRRELMR
jgi:hypothetical protein